MKTFYTHSWYKRPFKITIDADIVRVHKCIGFDRLANSFQYASKFREYHPLQIFVGDSDNPDPEDRGNSFLLHIKDLKYIYVGDSIKSFKALSPIVTYKSKIGNNDVPYPFAQDDQRRNYLMLEDVILTKYKDDCPYEWYYEERIIRAYNNEPCQLNINSFLFKLTFKENPQQHWNDIIEDLIYEEDQNVSKNVLKSLKRCANISITTASTKYPLTCREYVKIIKEFGEQLGLKKLNMRTLVPCLKNFNEFYIR